MKSYPVIQNPKPPKSKLRNWEIIFCLPTTDIYLRGIGQEIPGIKTVKFYDRLNRRIVIAEHPVDFLERASKWSDSEKVTRRFSAGIIKNGL